MSILIKGIDMPKLHKTYKVRFVEENDRIVIGVAIGDSSAYRLLGEVIIVPTPHGKLKDADALEQSWIWGSTDRTRNVECIELCDLKNAPTIIEAED